MGTRPSATPNDLAARAAAEVRAELAYRGLRVNALDGVLGSHNYVHARLSPEKATIALNLNDLVKIAEFFGWPLEELIDRARVPRSSGSPSLGAVAGGYDARNEELLQELLPKGRRRATKPTLRDTPKLDD